MGFCRLIYRIGRMIFRDFLFKIPKKYLVIIIVFLTMFLIKSNVFAVSSLSEEYMSVLSNMPEYKSGNYYVFAGTFKASTLAPYKIKTYFFPKSSGARFYRATTLVNHDYGIYFSSGSPYKLYLSNLDGSSMTETSVNNEPMGFKYYDGETYFYSNTYVYTNNSYNDIWYSPPVTFIEPSVTNNLTELADWSFDYLLINGGSLVSSTQYGQNYFSLEQVYNGNSSVIDIDNYYTELNGVLYFTIPRDKLLSNNAIINGKSVEFNLIYYNMSEGGRDIITYKLVNFTLGLSQTEQDNINEDKTQQGLDNIANAQQQTTNAINNMNSNISNINNSINDLSNNITNDNVSSSVIQQPSVPNDTSGVENGVNNIFNVIMNAFTNFNSNQDVVLPIPFTNKNIIISGNYTRDMLNSVNAGWIINFITIFWWYIISVYIIKDILKTVDKIQEGNIDKIESSNIKGDML